MTLSFSALRRTVHTVALLPFALVFACGADSGSNGGPNDGAVTDGSHNPMNDAGLGPARVSLGSTTNLAASGSYVLLAKTEITNVTGSLITGGHVGLSPAAGSFISGFSETADPSDQFTTSASVAPPGRIYAAGYTEPTPTLLTSAILDMERAYTDAAGRTHPNFLNFATGEIGGETLAPGLYTWGTGVTIPTNVTIAGGANDVWIFQIAGDLDISTATSVILSGNASPANIFWQVTGQVVIHANAHFEGIILCKTQITFQTMATMDGRALAQTLIALDNNAITAP